MVLHFRQPLFQTLEAAPLCDIVDQKHAHCLAVVRVCDSTVALLTGRVPNLGPHCGALAHLDVVGGELHANGGGSFVFKLVLGVAQKQLRLAHTAVPDQHNFEHKFVLGLSLWLLEKLVHWLHLS